MESAVTAQSRPTPICVSTMPSERRAESVDPGNCERRVVQELAAADQAQPADAREDEQAQAVAVQDLLIAAALGTVDAEDKERQEQAGAEDHAGREAAARRVLPEEHDVDRSRAGPAGSAAG